MYSSVDVDVGVSLPLSRSWGNGTLVVGSVTEEAEGDYLCEANNGVGTGLSQIINLQVHGKVKVKELRGGGDRKHREG